MSFGINGLRMISSSHKTCQLRENSKIRETEASLKVTSTRFYEVEATKDVKPHLHYHTSLRFVKLLFCQATKNLQPNFLDRELTQKLEREIGFRTRSV